MGNGYGTTIFTSGMTMPGLRQLGLGSLLAAALGCGRGEETRGGGEAALRPVATGTLTIGERTFSFQVRNCDVGEVQSSGGETLRGTGQTEAGQRLTVVVDRSGDHTLFHNVSLTYGAVMSGTGFTAQAIRSRLRGADWPPDPQGVGPTGPLVRIEGHTVRAQATFSVDDAGAKSAVPGRLEATCP